MKIDLALTLLIEILKNAQVISSMIQQAQASGQTVLSQDQWKQILAADVAARGALVAALTAP